MTGAGCCCNSQGQCCYRRGTTHICSACCYSPTSGLFCNGCCYTRANALCTWCRGYYNSDEECCCCWYQEKKCCWPTSRICSCEECGVVCLYERWSSSSWWGPLHAAVTALLYVVLLYGLLRVCFSDYGRGSWKGSGLKILTSASWTDTHLWPVESASLKKYPTVPEKAVCMKRDYDLIEVAAKVHLMPFDLGSSIYQTDSNASQFLNVVATRQNVQYYFNLSRRLICAGFLFTIVSGAALLLLAVVIHARQIYYPKPPAEPGTQTQPRAPTLPGTQLQPGTQMPPGTQIPPGTQTPPGTKTPPEACNAMPWLQFFLGDILLYLGGTLYSTGIDSFNIGMYDVFDEVMLTSSGHVFEFIVIIIVLPIFVKLIPMNRKRFLDRQKLMRNKHQAGLF